MQRWSPGDAVLWRTGRDGRVWSAHPMTVVRVLRREPPLDEPWERWRPDPSWPLATLPDGWDIA